MEWLYLAALIIAISGMAVIDWCYKLAYWYDRKRTLLCITTAVAVFIIWDTLGIVLGIFFHGGSQFTLPFRIAPEFPVEELFFLTLLCYCTLVIYRGATRLWPRT